MYHWLLVSPEWVTRFFFVNQIIQVHLPFPRTVYHDNLYYKQSGKYGYYTITKSSANAYKYYLLGANKAYDQLKSKISKSEYNKYVKKLKAYTDYDTLLDSVNTDTKTHSPDEEERIEWDRCIREAMGDDFPF